ncbi:transcription factor DIVARICATA-like [Nymphaea colorata]|nr:transcription factor DIVARICATA-like [Nymphaea colorata]
MFSDEFSGHPLAFMDQYTGNWTPQQNKLFEHALAVVPEDAPDRWQRIAAFIAGKSPWEVRQHYEELLRDLSEIESGRFELPDYEEGGSGQAAGGKGKSVEGERRKGVPWTEEEHRLFLIGLQKYGKGDWRSISRNAVITRTPTQVASHAQKYYLRLNSVKKEKKRSSIHDITTVDDTNLPHSPPQMMTSVGPSSSMEHQQMPGSYTSAATAHNPYQALGPSGFDHFGYNF